MGLTPIALMTSSSASTGWAAPGFRQLGTMSQRGRHEADGCSAYLGLLKWRMCAEGLAGGAEGGDSKSSGGEDHSQRAAAVAVVAKTSSRGMMGMLEMRHN